MQRTKKDILEATAREAGIGISEADKIVMEFIRQINAAMIAGDSLEIRGWGRWSIKKRGRWIGRNPKSGDKILVHPKKSVRFKAGKLLNESVNKK